MSNNKFPHGITKPVIKNRIIYVPSDAKPLIDKGSIVWGTAPASEKIKVLNHTKKTAPATRNKN